MTWRTLLFRSLRFHARAHLGVVLGAAVGSAALIGALAVGDSVRVSLRDLAVQRLGGIYYAMAPSDRFFRARLDRALGESSVSSPGSEGLSAVSALRLPSTASSQNGAARGNHVQLLGVPDAFERLGGDSQLASLAPDGVALNEALSAQLNAKAGETILLRFPKPSALSQDAIISPRNESSVALRLRVQVIVPASGLGNFNLSPSQVPPYNAFVRLEALSKAANLAGRANLLLTGPVRVDPGKEGPTNVAERLNATLEKAATLSDLELELRDLPAQSCVELRSSRIFLDAPVVAAARAAANTNASEVLTYLVNQFRAGDRATPYSMVTAMGAPVVPAEMREDEILINQWLAEDLQAGPGAEIALTYFLADSGARLVERTNHFRVRAIVPMVLPYADRTLMPDFPGIAKAESTHDWDAGFPLTLKIREQDDKYWKEWRGTPKAFVTLAAGQKLWGNRFGEVTAIRFPRTGTNAREALSALEGRLRNDLRPGQVGLRFEPVRAQALAAADQAQDFGQLFLGFSFFLILAALILIALLFQFGLEQRTAEVGTFLALGFTARQVRRVLLGEGAALALAGGVIGVAGGLGYARAMLLGLATVWRGAVGTSALQFHASAGTLLIGLGSSVVVSAVTLWLVLRKQARRPARELLAEGSETAAGRMEGGGLRRSWGGWIGLVAAASALGMVGWALWKNEMGDAETFFSAGSLFLVGGLGFCAALFASLARASAGGLLTIGSLGLRGCARRRQRSLATVGLLACGSFLVVSIGAFKLDAEANAGKRSSGTGGFAFLGQSTLPIVQDLNSTSGREFFGLNSKELDGVDVLALRVHDGDEASCLNLNRAQTPRLLGVNPQALQSRGAFSFAKLAAGCSAEKPWLNLQGKPGEDAVPAVGDLNSILWALGKKVGDRLSLTDGKGRPFQVRLVGGLANSILQGSLIISEEEFLKHYPGESGYRTFLIDAPTNRLGAVSAALSRAVQDVGLELTPAAGRLAALNAVQNTYLKTFQVLGGLGLLLGSAGLGVVVLRNVLERRGELALLQAVGFRRSTLHWLVMSEHGGLLWIGLTVGLMAALVAILPVLLAPGAEVPYVSLLATLGGVFLSGMVWTWLATWVALRGELLKALRNE